MARRDLTIPLLFGLGGAVVLAFTQRKTIMLYGSKALEAGKELAFAAAIGAQRASARQYAPIILRVARETNVDPFLIFALGDRESRWGDALSPRGPGGTGDAGHGHGIMQIDDRSFGAWLATNRWQDPYTNVRKGAEVLKAKLAFFSGRSAVKGLTNGSTVTVNATQAERRKVAPGAYPDPRPLTGQALLDAGIAAYNTGEGSVLMSLAVGRSVDTTTAGGDYLADVWDRMVDAVSRFS